MPPILFPQIRSTDQAVSALSRRLRPGELTLIVGPQGVGQTDLIVALASLASLGETSPPVGYFSPLRPAGAVVDHCLSLATGSDLRQIRHPLRSNAVGQMVQGVKIDGFLNPHADLTSGERQQIQVYEERLATSGLRIDDTPQPTIRAVTRRCDEWDERGRLSLVCVESLELVRLSNVGDGRADLPAVVEVLAELALTLRAPIVVGLTVKEQELTDEDLASRFQDAAYIFTLSESSPTSAPAIHARVLREGAEVDAFKVWSAQPPAGVSQE